MASIRLVNVTKTFKNTTAIDHLDMDIKDGEFFCVLGPPGAGKTTLLRLIVGLEKPDAGELLIDGEPMKNVHPSRRDISMIFQNLALYPDKSVFDNIAVPLRQQNVPDEQIAVRVENVAKQLRIDWLLEKLPSQLSGGERQRVAIGRAIVRQPKAYLMDEPLSNLDALLRLEMRVSLKELQTSLKETFVYVTHDQVEALSMGDRIAVLDRGVLQQIDDPETIYRKPNNMFVATILGNPPMNFLSCTLREEKKRLSLEHDAFSVSTSNARARRKIKEECGDGKLVLGIRPEDVRIHAGEKTGVRSEELVEAELYVTEPLGNETIVDVKIGENVIKVLSQADFQGTSGQKIRLEMNCAKMHLFHHETHRCVLHVTGEESFRINGTS
jgi:ABC-type sugar transport system ATPase subunit